MFIFNVVYAAIALSIFTELTVIGTFTLIICSCRRKLKLEFRLYSILISLWIPFTVCFRLMLYTKWNENFILSHYQKPKNCLIAVECCFCLTCILILDTVLFYISNRRSFSPKFENIRIENEGQPGFFTTCCCTPEATLDDNLTPVGDV